MSLPFLLKGIKPSIDPPKVLTMYKGCCILKQLISQVIYLAVTFHQPFLQNLPSSLDDIRSRHLERKPVLSAAYFLKILNFTHQIPTLDSHAVSQAPVALSYLACIKFQLETLLLEYELILLPRIFPTALAIMEASFHVPVTEMNFSVTDGANPIADKGQLQPKLTTGIQAAGPD
uniref:Uncharacterized protein n=1 Tax=Salix viminalis TaxID=40686 RepID=A0A6N2MGE4_SALVM